MLRTLRSSGWLKAADMCRELDMRWEGRGHIVTMVEAAVKSWDPSKRFGKHRKVLSRKALWLDLCLRKNTRVERQGSQEASMFVQVVVRAVGRWGGDGLQRYSGRQ